MTVTLMVRDETTAGSVYGELPLEFPSERITVRELIRASVYQEGQDFNRQRSENVFRGLVQPSDTERVLNGHRPEYRLKQHREWRRPRRTHPSGASLSGWPTTLPYRF